MPLTVPAMTKTLTRDQLSQIETELRTELAQLTKQVVAVSRTDKDLAEARASLDERAASRGDADSLGVERHLLSKTQTTLANSIFEINEALARIGDGSYGICAKCAHPIPALRLLARPKSPCCVRCA